MLEEIKEKVYKANMDLVKYGLVIFTWGNVSEIDRKTNLVVIKPSGVDYENLSPDDMVVVDLNGNVIEGRLKPSSDTLTHLEIYKSNPLIGGITHTHSTNAVAFAQAGIPIKALGTTHADYFYGDIPCTRSLLKNEVENNYEKNTGVVISEKIKDCNIDPLAIPGILVKNHGPFTFGIDSVSSVYHAVVLEKIAEINIKTLIINDESNMEKYILDKHYQRKHGPNSYYGQK